MQIMVNGESRQVPDTTTVAALVRDMGLGGRRVAVEVNRDIIPRSRHNDHSLREGDRIEVVAAIGGG